MKKIKALLNKVALWTRRLVAVVVVFGALYGASHAYGFYRPPKEIVEKIIQVPVVAPKRPVRELINNVANDYGIPPLLFEAVVKHESAYRVNASRFESHHMKRAAKFTKIPEQQRHYATSWGLGQVMGWHAPKYGLEWHDLLDPETNLKVSADILSKCIERHKSKKPIDKIKGALVCYNGSDQYPPRVLFSLGEILAERM